MAIYKQAGEIRRINLRALVERWGSVQTCERLGITRQQLSQLISLRPRRNIGPTLARRIEAEFRLPRNYFDSLHETPSELQKLIEAIGDLSADKVRLLLTIALELRKHDGNK